MRSPKIYREIDGKKIEGQLFWVIVYNVNYWLSQAIVYADGMIDCWGLMHRYEFIEKLDSGFIRIDVPANSELYMELSVIRVKDFEAEKDKEDFIKEIDEAILELSGQESNSMLCRKLFKKYLLDNSDETLQELGIMFNKLPKHKRVLFEYVDFKDPLVKIMDGEVKSFDAENRKWMLNDYFEGEWEIDQFK